jgi:uncharacterized RDD family membrane protein YckC
MFCPQCSQPVPEHARFCPACGNELPTEGAPDPADEFAGPVHAPAGTLGYAGFWRRAVAFVIDSVVLMVIGFPLGLIPAVAVLTEDDPAAFIGKLAAAIVTRGLLSWLYFALMESSGWQATLGKRALGLRVTDSTGARIHFGRATGRFFGKMLSGALLGLGFVMAAFTARRQALHDLLAGTLVVR